MVITKQPAKTLSTFDRSIGIADLFLRVENTIAKALMVPLVVIKFHELVDGSAQRVLAKEDHAIQAGFRDAAHKTLRVSVQIGGSGRQPDGFHTLLFQKVTKLRGEDSIAIHNQIARAQQEPVKRIGDVPGNLLDPIRVWIGRDSGNMYSSG